MRLLILTLLLLLFCQDSEQPYDYLKGDWSVTISVWVEPYNDEITIVKDTVAFELNRDYSFSERVSSDSAIIKGLFYWGIKFDDKGNDEYLNGRIDLTSYGILNDSIEFQSEIHKYVNILYNDLKDSSTFKWSEDSLTTTNPVNAEIVLIRL